jgi:hypothetical protein
MTKDEVLKLIADIRGLNNHERNKMDNGGEMEITLSTSECSIEHEIEHEIDDDAIKDFTILDADKQEIKLDLDEMVSRYGGKIYNDRLVDANTISRKEYLSITKNLTRDQVMSHPLVHVLFRSEGQSSSNFFEWVNSFKEKR